MKDYNNSSDSTDKDQQKKRRLIAVGGAMALLVAVPAGAAYLNNLLVGRQPDGSVLVTTNQVLNPAGTKIEFAGRPNASALSPDGKTAALLNGNGSPVVLIDLATGTVKQRFGSGSASYDGIVYSPDGTRLYASLTNGRILIADVSSTGDLTQNSIVTLPVTSGLGNPYPGGLAISADGKTLYIALSRYNALGVFDTASSTLTAQIPVGNAPHAVLVSGNKAYVSNQGGRVAVAGDFTNDSAGTPIVADPKTGGSVTGTVSVVNLASGTVGTTLPVGLQPTALMKSGPYLFVANTHGDSVSVIDTGSDQVVKTIDIKPFPNAPFGSTPNALAMIEGNRLVVSLGTNNALAVYPWRGPAEPTPLLGLIPTEWFPGSIIVDNLNQRLAIANVKGVGSLGPYATRYSKVGRQTYAYVGSSTFVPFPSAADLARYTLQVWNNNSWGRILTANGSAKAAPQAIPARLGDPSLIKHVFYIIKENRTYDQVFGDDLRGNSDPNLVVFGADVTPNQHALARQFPLLDNFYNSGVLSADGHQWAVQAYVPDYLERAFASFVRSYPFNGGDSLAYAPSGFIWQNALDNGKTVRVYGEYTNEFTGPSDQFGQWIDWYNDALILRGEQSGNLHVPIGAFQTSTDVPALQQIINPVYPPYTNQIPDIYRTELFLQEFNQFVANGNLPNLTIIQLNTDHTSGTAANYPTPRAQVADNDLAVGRVVDAISHSPYWQESAIFITEDDTQDGVDHVDGHRAPALVISPYARRGIVDGTYYTQLSVLRTINQILGLPPLTQLELAAQPMRNSFTNSPDFTPFSVLPNIIPLNELNPGSSASPVQAAWMKESNRMFAKRSFRPDEQNEQLLNRVIWYSATQFKRPYPGDRKILLPSEVLAQTSTKDRD